MSSTSLLLDTRYSENPLTPYKTKFAINFPALNTIGNYAVKLVTVEFPNTVYPINEFNNLLSLSEDSGVSFASVILTSNNYTGDQYASELSTQLTAASPSGDTYTASYDKQSKRITIKNPTRTWQLGSTEFDNHIELGVSSSQLNTDTAFDGSDYTMICDFALNICGTSYVDVITNLSSHSHTVGSSRQVMVRIPTASSFGNIVFYEPSKPEEQFVSHSQLNDIFLELRDDRNNLFKLPENAHVSINLMIRQIINEKIPDMATTARMHSERYAHGRDFGLFGSGASNTRILNSLDVGDGQTIYDRPLHDKYFPPSGPIKR
jgi:hypothetical protein